MTQYDKFMYYYHGANAVLEQICKKVRYKPKKRLYTLDDIVRDRYSFINVNNWKGLLNDRRRDIERVCNR